MIILRNGKGSFFGWINTKFCFRDMDKNIISCLQYTTLTSSLKLIFNDLLEFEPTNTVRIVKVHGMFYVQLNKLQKGKPRVAQIGQV